MPKPVGLLLIAGSVISLWIAWTAKDFNFKGYSPEFHKAATNLIVTLTIIAAILERSAAVLNTFLFGSERKAAETSLRAVTDQLRANEEDVRHLRQLEQQLVRENRSVEFTATVVGRLQSERASLEAQRGSAISSLSEAEGCLNAVMQREDQVRLMVGLFASLLVAAVGVRALGSLISSPDQASAYFNVVDVLITASLLAGGSQGIAQITEVIRKVLELTKTNLTSR
jgi:hypothetical protein